MRIRKNIALLTLLFLFVSSLSSCRLGEFLSEADTETNAELEPEEESGPVIENWVDVEEDDF